MPFGGIFTAEDISEDPHYAARENLATVADDDEGDIVMPAVIPKLSDTPGRIAYAGPKIGSFNEEIYGGLLGKSTEELATPKEEGDLAVIPIGTAPQQGGSPRSSAWKFLWRGRISLRN